MRRGAAVATALLVVLAAAGIARAEIEQEGGVVVSLDGGISPHALPRDGVAPVAVSIDSGFKSSDGADPPPQLRQISIAINRGGRIFDRGLPTCRVREIQPATINAARRICGGAIVGSGHAEVRVRLTNQQPFTFKGPLLAFNGKRADGKRRLLVQVYGSKPPSAFVLTFKVVPSAGTYGTVIKTTLPAEAREWAYVTRFELQLRRIYTYRGKQRSYVSAGCPAPEGFPGVVYPFAKASFGFANGNRVGLTLVRDCAVR